MRLMELLGVLSRREFIYLYYIDGNDKGVVLYFGEAGGTTIYPPFYGCTVLRVSHIEAGISIEIEVKKNAERV